MYYTFRPERQISLNDPIVQTITKHLSFACRVFSSEPLSTTDAQLFQTHDSRTRTIIMIYTLPIKHIRAHASHTIIRTYRERERAIGGSRVFGPRFVESFIIYDSRARVCTGVGLACVHRTWHSDQNQSKCVELDACVFVFGAIAWIMYSFMLEYGACANVHVRACIARISVYTMYIWQFVLHADARHIAIYACVHILPPYPNIYIVNMCILYYTFMGLRDCTAATHTNRKTECDLSRKTFVQRKSRTILGEGDKQVIIAAATDDTGEDCMSYLLDLLWSTWHKAYTQNGTYSHSVYHIRRPITIRAIAMRLFIGWRRENKWVHFR